MKRGTLSAYIGLLLLFYCRGAQAVTYNPGPVTHCPETGHYYRRVDVAFASGDNFTWSAANAYAMGSQYLSLPGHLVTINSSAERNCLIIHNNLGGYMATAGAPPNWVWTAGPEAGTSVVFYNTYRGFNYGPVPQYCNPKDQVYYQGGEYWDVPASMYAQDCAPGQQAGFAIEYEENPTPTSPTTWGRVKTTYR